MQEAINYFTSLYFKIYNFIKYSDNTDLAIMLFQIVTIVIALYLIYQKTIKGTKAEQLVRGIFVLILLYVISEVLIKINLQIWGVFLKGLLSIIAFSLIVIFQPELRRFLGYLGQTNFVHNFFNDNQSGLSDDLVDTNIIVQKLIDTTKYLSKNKTGALIVIQKETDYKTYTEVGVEINAKLSPELLLTIFHPNTPLHDGACIICKDKILAAGALLPLTDDPKLSWKYGTRHRAAIGLSEISDAACLVVSEETGDISIAMDGLLKKYDDIANLRTDLFLILGFDNNNQKSKKYFFNIPNLLHRKKNEK